MIAYMHVFNVLASLVNVFPLLSPLRTVAPRYNCCTTDVRQSKSMMEGIKGPDVLKPLRFRRCFEILT